MGARPARRRMLRLRLYVAGNAPNSLSATASAQAICAEHFPAAHELEIIDLMDHPKRGLDDGVIVTPTLLRLSPKPIRRVIGNLSDRNRVLMMLQS
jgi:circadian clock protein KaiB